MAATMMSSKMVTAAFGTKAASRPRANAVKPVAALGSPPPSGGVYDYAKTLPGISDPFPEIFDPANLLERANGSARPINELKRWREAEITHGRVSMLAALGFVVGEQLENYPAFLNADGHVVGPAINHFQQVEARGAIFWEPLIFVIALAESYRVNVGWENPAGGRGFNALREDYAPGELGFDPLGLLPEDPQEKYDLQTKELNNGRLAMIGIAGFVAQELVDGQEIFTRLAGGPVPEVIKNTS